MIKGEHWDGAGLATALVSSEEAVSGQIVVTIGKANGADAPDDMIKVTLPECGDLPVALGVAKPRIIASVMLCDADSVPDRAKFEQTLLRANKVMPFSSFALTNVNGKDVYEIFGELSTGSEIEEIIEEILALGTNAIGAAETIESWKAGSAKGSI